MKIHFTQTFKMLYILYNKGGGVNISTFRVRRNSLKINILVSKPSKVLLNTSDRCLLNGLEMHLWMVQSLTQRQDDWGSHSDRALTVMRTSMWTPILTRLEHIFYRQQGHTQKNACDNTSNTSSKYRLNAPRMWFINAYDWIEVQLTTGCCIIIISMLNRQSNTS
jgi:hypothetical protein